MEQLSPQNLPNNDSSAEQSRQDHSFYGESESLKREVARSTGRTAEELEEYIRQEAYDIHVRKFPYLTRD